MLCKTCNQREVPPHRMKKRQYMCNRCIRERWPASREKQRKKSAEKRHLLRDALFDHYGRVCAYCGSTSELQFDHVNGDGHNNVDKRWPTQLKWFEQLIADGFPPTCQVLCKQCNIAKQQLTNEQFKFWIVQVALHLGLAN